MRPVTRGDAPTNAVTYEEMRPTLIKERIGCYCSYCEYPVKHVPHAEHIVPKERFPTWRDRWDNLLVSCTFCNSHKGNKLPRPETLDNYLWPTRDNTARAFSYANVFPRIADGLPSDIHKKAALLGGLVKLWVPNDTRADDRANAFIMAQNYFSRMTAARDQVLFRDMIVDVATQTGFFSVWMEVFASDPEMRRRLIVAFKGTAQDCFDPVTTDPLQRPGGRL